MIHENEKKKREELLRLIRENPELPVVPMVDGDIPGDCGGYWLGAWGNAIVDEYLISDRDERVCFKYVPPLKIQGIKTKLVPLIKQSVVMQANSVWIEPFMGSGVVGFNVEPHLAIFADTNPHIIEFYKQIKSGTITANVVRNFLEREGK